MAWSRSLACLQSDSDIQFLGFLPSRVAWTATKLAGSNGTSCWYRSPSTPNATSDIGTNTFTFIESNPRPRIAELLLSLRFSTCLYKRLFDLKTSNRMLKESENPLNQSGETMNWGADRAKISQKSVAWTGYIPNIVV